jgi:hypothetical protein
MSERYKSRTREGIMRGSTSSNPEDMGEEQQKTEKLRAMIEILQEKLAKVALD